MPEEQIPEWFTTLEKIKETIYRKVEYKVETTQDAWLHEKDLLQLYISFKILDAIANKPVSNRIVIQEETYTVIACSECGLLKAFYPNPTKITMEQTERLYKTLPRCRCKVEAE